MFVWVVGKEKKQMKKKKKLIWSSAKSRDHCCATPSVSISAVPFSDSDIGYGIPREISLWRRHGGMSKTKLLYCCYTEGWLYYIL
jgi:hypothetical protein